MNLNSVKHKILFNDGSKKIYTLHEIITENIDVSTISSVMPMLASLSNIEIFKGDVIELTTSDLSDTDGFWNSYAGQFVREHGYDKVIISVPDDDKADFNYNITFEKDGKVVTEEEHYKYSEEDKVGLSEKELSELKLPYTQKNLDEGRTFVRYILGKGGLVF